MLYMPGTHTMHCDRAILTEKQWTVVILLHKERSIRAAYIRDFIFVVD